ncbi:transposable element Tcb1 transposase [Trichonephila clavipes]|uniref:Transposable element Tcb1 transposase n=1 Tax=Trichonephila clavipes TaxID=2585209 RepID=A0A8X6SDZ6_TRICX|nr:transposable element Tcb1 transposase [Trichonephila clavipes]
MSELKDEVIDGWKDRKVISECVKGLEVITEKVEEVVANPLALKKWNVGDFCRVRYDDGFYYEGVIKDLKKNVYKVEYIGYYESDRFHRSALVESFGEEARERQIEEAGAFNYRYNDKYGKAAQSGRKDHRYASKSHGYEENLSECGACAPTPVQSEDEDGKAGYNRRSGYGKKDRNARAPTPGACGCMPKIPFPQLPKECLKNPLIEAMLRSWFMNGYYAGMYAANKNGGHAGERGSSTNSNIGYNFQEIGSRVGRNQTNVMRICDRWMQECTTDQRDRSHPPKCTTSLSSRIIRRRLQQSGLSARRPLLGLPLTQNHRRLRRQWCDERRMWDEEWNEKLSLLTSHASVCNTTMVGFESGDTVGEDVEQLRYAPPRWSCTGYYGMGRYWISSLSHSSSTHCRCLKTASTTSRCTSQLSFLTFRAWPQPYLNRIMRDRMWHALSKGSSSIIRLNCFPGRLPLWIFRR